MEEQEADAVAQQTHQALNKNQPLSLTSTSAQPLRSASLSASEPSLRFPRIQVNRHLESWISSSQTEIMTPSTHTVEESGLSDSTYEFITTDDESQDGLATESLRSFDDARPDDMQSLAGTERSDSGIDTEPESEEEQEEEEYPGDDRSQSSSIQYAEESLNSPSPRLSASSGAWPSDDTPHATPLARSIAFPESKDSQDVEQVSVKHTVREFSADDAVAVCRDMKLPVAPKRLTATIRQTMARKCAVTQSHFKVVYVGNAAVRDVIAGKIAAALAAGADTSGDSICKDGPTAAPSRVESLQLTTKTNLRLKIKQCTSARETIYQGSSYPGETVYSVTIDEKQSYESVFRPNGSIIEPEFALPDVAVFYITSEDDDRAIQTREAAWGFMRRHLVPCIFISDVPAFNKYARRWAKFINQHAVHLCLEASEEVPSFTRLPIDLSSFLNIDNRQMNRNLACLASLNETSRSSGQPTSLFASYSKMLREEARRATDALGGRDLSLTAFKLSVLALAVFMLNMLPYLIDFAAPREASSVVPSSSTVSLTPSIVDLHTIESDQTSTINSTTSTSTSVQIPRVNASPSNFAIIPFSNLFPDMKAPDSAQKPVCSAELHSGHEIVVKIPLKTKTAWLGKDSITIDVLRDGHAVKAKFSSIDEGLLIEIPKSEAHGIVTVTLVTSRKPKVNETFEVDFGKTLSEHVSGLIGNAQEKMVDALTDVAESINQAKLSWTGDIIQKACNVSAGVSDAVKYAEHAWADLLGTKQVAQVQASVHHARDQLEDTAGFARLSILRAQIASRLWWLKMQGKTEEHREYRTKASEFLTKKHAELIQARKARQPVDMKAHVRCGTHFWNRSSQGCKAAAP